MLACSLLLALSFCVCVCVCVCVCDDFALIVCSHATGKIVIVDAHDIPAWAFCERAYLALADPKALMQATLYPSQLGVEYHQGDGQRVERKSKDGLKDTRPVLGVVTQTIRDGGFIQFFNSKLPFALMKEDGSRVDKTELEEKAEDPVLWDISSSVYVRDLMLGDKGVVSICTFPHQGSRKFKPQDRKAATLEFEPAIPSGKDCIFDAYNLMANPAGVERKRLSLFVCMCVFRPTAWSECGGAS